MEDDWLTTHSTKAFCISTGLTILVPWLMAILFAYLAFWSRIWRKSAKVRHVNCLSISIGKCQRKPQSSELRWISWWCLKNFAWKRLHCKKRWAFMFKCWDQGKLEFEWRHTCWLCSFLIVYSHSIFGHLLRCCFGTQPASPMLVKTEATQKWVVKSYLKQYIEDL